MSARNGDHLMISFQCGICHYRNVKGINLAGAKNALKLLRNIRRENLDSFWSREPGKILSTRRDCLKLFKISLPIGLYNVFPTMGPFPVEDSLGMVLAVCMLIRSLGKGIHQSTLQFESVRKCARRIQTGGMLRSLR